MKKNLIIALSLSMLVAAAPAMADVWNSKHNLGAAGTSTYRFNGTSEVCAFCHTPHNANLAIPLWVRSTQGTVYGLYSSSGTLTTAAFNVIQIGSDNISFKCLNCHDGQTAIATGAASGVLSVTTLDPVNAGANFDNARANFGSDLGDDHPIGFDYVVAANDTFGDGDLVEPVASTTGSSQQQVTANGGAALPFFKAGSRTNQLECATCHDVHNSIPTNSYMLRRANSSSLLCRSCHQK